MSDFRKLGEGIYASPQIGLADIAQAAQLGVTLVINNRPEGESDEQTPGAEIEAAAHAAGMDYIAIPVTMQSLSQDDVSSMAQALGEAHGPVLAYCRSGTRSTLLWSLAEAMRGREPAEIADAAAAAGYDVAPVRAAMDAIYSARG
ncbi:TIGR01244 family sulfur transferase [Altererythrobacter fulvus]|uniref:TIGR01244 family sulfur transferase n=1 Tax=Caenibius fulvus TaxID=2126012 RepID=UPI00301B11F8